MKKIEINGKYQQHKINKANDPNNYNIISKRDCMQKIPSFSNYDEKIMLNKLYLDQEFEYKKNMLQEITKKVNSYKTQDINKNKYKEDNINIEETIEKLVESKLKCFYCSSEMKIFYKNVREMDQWTLDRIDNNTNHNSNNIVVACLKCNLQRRRQDKNKFLLSKQLKIIKE
tara:strand:- start:1607 stop:2122 length:516 start_codon:yes stop_codon:yes gene_type:complete